MKQIVLMALCLGFVAVPALAQERTETVKFAAGASSKTISGKIKGYDGVSYILGANAGQVMQVLFAPNNKSCNMNVYLPGRDEAVFRAAGNEYSANLTKSGEYRIQVFLMRNAARRKETCAYKITFEIGG